MASANGHTDVARILLEARANIEIKDDVSECVLCMCMYVYMCMCLPLKYNVMHMYVCVCIIV